VWDVGARRMGAVLALRRRGRGGFRAGKKETITINQLIIPLIILGEFTKMRKRTISVLIPLCTSLGLCVQMKQLFCNWTCFMKFILRILSRIE